MRFIGFLWTSVRDFFKWFTPRPDWVLDYYDTSLTPSPSRQKHALIKTISLALGISNHFVRTTTTTFTTFYLLFYCISLDRILPKDMSAFMKENCAHKCDSNAYTYFTVAMPQNRFQTGALDIKNKDGKLIRLNYVFSRRLNFLYIVIAKKNSLKESSIL